MKWMDRQTDIWKDVKTVYPHTNTVWGGYKNKKNIINLSSAEFARSGMALLLEPKAKQVENIQNVPVQLRLISVTVKCFKCCTTQSCYNVVISPLSQITGKSLPDVIL